MFRLWIWSHVDLISWFNFCNLKITLTFLSGTVTPGNDHLHVFGGFFLVGGWGVGVFGFVVCFVFFFNEKGLKSLTKFTVHLWIWLILALSLKLTDCRDLVSIKAVWIFTVLFLLRVQFHVKLKRKARLSDRCSIESNSHGGPYLIAEPCSYNTFFPLCKTLVQLQESFYQVKSKFKI